MKSVSEIRRGKTAVFSFMRCNPPTRGHILVMETMYSLSKEIGADPFLFLSHTQDNKNNPLSYEEKLYYLEIQDLELIDSTLYRDFDGKIKTPYAAIKYLLNEGYDNIIAVVGSDRSREYLEKFHSLVPNGKFDVKVAGLPRDSESENIQGISSTKARNLVVNNELEDFLKVIPRNLNQRFGVRMFNVIKSRIKNDK